MSSRELQRFAYWVVAAMGGMTILIISAVAALWYDKEVATGMDDPGIGTTLIGIIIYLGLVWLIQESARGLTWSLSRRLGVFVGIPLVAFVATVKLPAALTALVMYGIAVYAVYLFLTKNQR